MKNSRFVTNWAFPGAISITCFWVFLMPWILLLNQSSTHSLLVMGFGAVLAVLSNITYLLVLIVRKQENVEQVEANLAHEQYVAKSGGAGESF